MQALMAADWFHKLGFTLPYGTNVADFILDLASGAVLSDERCVQCSFRAPPPQASRVRKTRKLPAFASLMRLMHAFCLPVQLPPPEGLHNGPPYQDSFQGL